MAFPSTLIDIGRIPELRGVRDDGDAIVSGAMTTHHDVMHDQLVRRYAPLIAQATATVGDPQVRHRGTFGGSLAHADPAGDLGAVALALGCEFVVSGPAGERRLAAADFFVDYLTTALAPAELLTAVRVPKPGDGWSSHYQKFNRVAQAWSIVGVGALVRLGGTSITEARVGLTNMGPTPLRGDRHRGGAFRRTGNRGRCHRCGVACGGGHPRAERPVRRVGLPGSPRLCPDRQGSPGRDRGH